ncbi:MAG: hypothetical protein H6679_00310 [Epsilonproteobacteria bacterium]|nr:hypothetical protein [Campylobacterota bacterium]
MKQSIGGTIVVKIQSTVFWSIAFLLFTLHGTTNAASIKYGDRVRIHFSSKTNTSGSGKVYLSGSSDSKAFASEATSTASDNWIIEGGTVGQAVTTGNIILKHESTGKYLAENQANQLNFGLPGFFFEVRLQSSTFNWFVYSDGGSNALDSTKRFLLSPGGNQSAYRLGISNSLYSSSDPKKYIITNYHHGYGANPFGTFPWLSTEAALPPAAPAPAPAPQPVPAPTSGTIYGNVWGIGPTNKVYFREGISNANPTGTSWSEVTGLLASNITVGPDGRVWALNTTAVEGGHQVYYREGITASNPKGTSWSRVDGGLALLATGLGGQLWGVNNSDNLFFRQGITSGNPKGTSWQHVNPYFKYIDAGSDTYNSVWATGSYPGVVYRHWGNTTTQPGTTWSPVESYEIKQIAVGPNGQPWGINASNEVVARTGITGQQKDVKGTGWQACATGAKFVGVTRSNQVWMVKNDNSIWVSETADMNNMAWQQIDGSLTKVSGGGMPAGYVPGPSYPSDEIQYGQDIRLVWSTYPTAEVAISASAEGKPFGSTTKTSNDIWTILPTSGQTGVVKHAHQFYLRHKNTGKFLCYNGSNATLDDGNPTLSIVIDSMQNGQHIDTSDQQNIPWLKNYDRIAIRTPSPIRDFFYFPGTKYTNQLGQQYNAAWTFIENAQKEQYFPFFKATPTTGLSTPPEPQPAPQPAPEPQPAPTPVNPTDNVWAVSESDGKVWFREGVTATKPEGTSWTEIPGLQARWINVSPRGEVWATTRTSSPVPYYRTGITPENPKGTSWTLVDGGNIMQIGAGLEGQLWCKTYLGELFYRTGITEQNPTGNGWTKITDGNVNAYRFAVGANGAVWATDSNQEAGTGFRPVYRTGVTTSSPGGTGWQTVTDGFNVSADLAVGPQGQLWTINTVFQASARLGITPSNPLGTSWSNYFTGMNSSLMSVSPNNNLWLINRSNQIFIAKDPTPGSPSFTGVGGAPSPLTVISAGGYPGTIQTQTLPPPDPDKYFLYDPASTPNKYDNKTYRDAWKLPEANRGIIQFRARGLNDLHVNLGPDKNNTHGQMYEILVGANNNAASYLKKQKVVPPFLSPVNASQFPQAVLEGGKPSGQGDIWNDFWIIVDQQFILVGKGTSPGIPEEIILWHQDPYPHTVNYFGLGGWDARVEFDNIRVAPLTNPPKITDLTKYTRAPNTQTIWEKADLKYHPNWKLPVQGSGSITFRAKAANNIIVSIAPGLSSFTQGDIPPDYDGATYFFNFGASNNTLSGLYKNNIDSAPIEFNNSANARINNANAFEDYWISVEPDGTLRAGKGSPGNAPLITHKDANFANNILQVGFGGKGATTVEFTNITFGQPLEIVPEISPQEQAQSIKYGDKVVLGIHSSVANLTKGKPNSLVVIATGSGEVNPWYKDQQVAYGWESATNLSEFTVLASHEEGDNARLGQAVRAGDTIRLKSIPTNLFLHSHADRNTWSSDTPPSIKLQEVTGYPNRDSNDNWELIVKDNSYSYWNKAAEVTLRHKATQKYLHVIDYRWWWGPGGTDAWALAYSVGAKDAPIQQYFITNEGRALFEQQQIREKLQPEGQWIIDRHGNTWGTTDTDHPQSAGNKELYFRKAGQENWEPIAGAITMLAAHPQKDQVWAINKDGSIFARLNVTSGNPQGNSWAGVPGNLTQIAINQDNHFAGTDSANKVYFSPTDDPGNPSWMLLLPPLQQSDTRPWELSIDDHPLFTGNKRVFFNTQNGWIEIEGAMKQLARRSNGHVWAIKNDNSIYFREGVNTQNPMGSSWKPVAGSLTSIGVNQQDTIIGTNQLGDNIFSLTNDPNNPQWRNVVPPLQEPYVVGPQGHTWALSVNDHTEFPGNKRIFHKLPDQWIEIDGALKKLAVGTNGQVWGINSTNTLFSRDGITAQNTAGSGWIVVPGNLKDILFDSQNNQFIGINEFDEDVISQTSDPNNPAWIPFLQTPDGRWTLSDVDHKNSLNNKYTFFKENNGLWNLVEGALSQISVSPNNEVWGIQANGNVFTRQEITPQNLKGSSWLQVPGQLSEIAVGNDGIVYGKTLANKGVFLANEDLANPLWLEVLPALQQSNTRPWELSQADHPLVPGEKRIFYNLGDKWVEVGGTLKQLVLRPNGDVWGINSEHEIYFRDGITQQNPLGTDWVVVPGKLADIRLDGNGTINGTTPEGQDVYSITNNPIDPAWRNLTPPLQSPVTGPDGHTWALSIADHPQSPGDKRIFFQEQDTSWSEVDGALKQISVGPGGQVWGTNINNQIFYRNGVTEQNPKGTDWIQTPGICTVCTINPDGFVTGITPDGDTIIFNGNFTNPNWVPADSLHNYDPDKQTPGSLTFKPEWGLPQPSRGNVLFKAKAQASIAIGLSPIDRTLPGNMYQLSIGGDNNTSTFITDGTSNRLQSTNNQEALIDNQNVFIPYWVTVYDDTIVVGRGVIPGENEFFRYQDQSPVQNLTNVGLGGLQNPVEFKDISIIAATKPTLLLPPLQTPITDPTTGSTWVLSEDDDPSNPGNKQIFFKHQDSDEWNKIEGSLTALAIHPTSGQIWGINANNDILARNGITAQNPAGTSWSTIQGKLKTIEIITFGTMPHFGGTNLNDQSIFSQTDAPNNPAWIELKQAQQQAAQEAEQKRINDLLPPATEWIPDTRGNNWALSTQQDSTGNREVFFQHAGQLWQALPDTPLKNLIVDNNGNLWAITGNSTVYTRDGITDQTPQGTTWTQIPGALEQINFEQDKNLVAGITPDQQGVYSQTGTPQNPAWIPYLNPVNNRWALSRDDHPAQPGNKRIFFKENNNLWTEIDGTLSQMSVGNNNQVWGVDNNSNVFTREGITPENLKGTNWKQVPGKLTTIDIDNDGIIFGTTPEGKEIYLANDDLQNPVWLEILPPLQQSDTRPWELSQADYPGYPGDKRVFYELPDGWTEVGKTPLKKLVVTPNAQVWGINNNGDTFYREGITTQNPTGTGWGTIPRKFVDIELDKNNNIVGTTPEGNKIYTPTNNPQNPEWRPVVPPLQPPQTDPNGNKWALSQGDSPDSPGNKEIFFQSQDSDQWNKLSGNLIDIAIHPTGGQVWGVNANNDIFAREGISSADRSGTGWTTVFGKLKDISIITFQNEPHFGGTDINDRIIFSQTDNAQNPEWTQLSQAEQEALNNAELERISSLLPPPAEWVIDGRNNAWALSMQADDNDNREIFFKGTNNMWTALDGQKLAALVADTTNVWGIDSTANIYTRQGITDQLPQGTNWLVVPGQLTEIHFDPTNNEIWGITPDGEEVISQTNNPQNPDWRPSIPPLQNEQTDPNGNTWALSKNDDPDNPGNKEIFFKPQGGNKWIKVNGGLIGLAVHPTDGQVWGVDANNTIFARADIGPAQTQGTEWLPVSGKLKDISIITFQNNPHFGGNNLNNQIIFSQTDDADTPQWTLLSQAEQKAHTQAEQERINSLLPSPAEWIIDGRNNTWALSTQADDNGNREVFFKGLDNVWLSIPEQKLAALIANPDNVWGVDGAANIYTRQGITDQLPQGTNWRIISGQLTEIHFDPTNNEIWGITPEGRRVASQTNNPQDPQWKVVPTPEEASAQELSQLTKELNELRNRINNLGTTVNTATDGAITNKLPAEQNQLQDQFNALYDKLDSLAPAVESSIKPMLEQIISDELNTQLLDPALPQIINQTTIDTIRKKAIDSISQPLSEQINQAIDSGIDQAQQAIAPFIPDESVIEEPASTPEPELETVERARGRRPRPTRTRRRAAAEPETERAIRQVGSEMLRERDRQLPEIVTREQKALQQTSFRQALPEAGPRQDQQDTSILQQKQAKPTTPVRRTRGQR